MGVYFNNLLRSDLTLSDGSTCVGGPFKNLIYNFDLDETKKICKIETTLQQNEQFVG